MKFDIYYPMQTRDGRIVPGIRPVPMEWDEIRKKVATDPKLSDLYQKIRSCQDKDKQAEWKAQLPSICYVGTCVQGTRAAANMQPTQMVMIDVDHCEGAQLAWETIKAEMGEWCKDNVMLAALTPRLGLRIVFAAQAGFSTLQENMDWFNKQFKLERFGDYDAPCKDFSRISFMFKHDELLYDNTRLYLNTGPQLKTCLVNEHFGSIKTSSLGGILQENGGKAAKQAGTKKTEKLSEEDENAKEFSPEEIADFQDYDYNGVPLKAIINKYIEVNGAPGRSQVHNFYNEMVKNFRNIADNNPRLLLYLLPRFGHTIDECRSQVESITRVNTLSSLPKQFYFFLKDNGYYTKKGEGGHSFRNYMLEETPQEVDDLPWLPPVFREFLAITPKDFRPSMINALLPIMGTLTTYLQGKYYFDNRMHTTSFFSIIYAPAGTGKGFVDEVVMEPLFEQLRVRDFVQTAREQIFLDMIGKKGANDKAPDDPHTSLRIIAPKNSEAEFLQKQRDNHGAHMFTYAAEMDSWAKGVRAAGGNKDDMIRVAWDNGRYGQHFKSANTFKGEVRLFWNVLITGTLQQILSYFKNVENGLITRCSFTTLDNQKFAEAPKWRELSTKAMAVIKKFTERCDRMTYEEPCELIPEEIAIIPGEKFDKEVNWHFKFRERVTVDMMWLKPTIDKFLKEQLEKASLDQDDARDVFRRRVAVRGFRLGLMCHALWEKPRKADLERCIPFIEWWMNKDIESSLALWGERYNNETATEVTVSQRSLYNSIGDKFTKADVYTQCLKQNIKTPVMKITSLWVNQGFAKRVGKNEFEKVKPKKND